MDIYLQHAILGLIQLGKYKYHQRKNILINTTSGKEVFIMTHNNRVAYRLRFGYSYHKDILVKDVIYILNYGIFNPKGEVINLDGDKMNNHPKNLRLISPSNEITPDLHRDICELFVKHNKGYTEIAKELGILKATARNVIIKEFGAQFPKRGAKNKKLHDSLKNDMRYMTNVYTGKK